MQINAEITCYDDAEKFGNEHVRSAAAKLDRILMKRNGIDGNRSFNIVKYWRILDVGCGSFATLRMGYGDWGPWFCLLCAQNGADVTGLDLNSSTKDGDGYEHIQVDLVPDILGGKLAKINGVRGKYDVVHASNLIGAPDLNETLPINIGYDEFVKRLRKQGYGITKRNGIMDIEGEMRHKSRLSLF